MPASFTKSTVVSVLKTVHDPEIPVDIYELGLIYEVVIKDDGFVHIDVDLVLSVPQSFTPPGACGKNQKDSKRGENSVIERINELVQKKA